MEAVAKLNSPISMPSVSGLVGTMCGDRGADDDVAKGKIGGGARESPTLRNACQRSAGDCRRPWSSGYRRVLLITRLLPLRNSEITFVTGIDRVWRSPAS
jgi:hypothetical protein